MSASAISDRAALKRDPETGRFRDATHLRSRSRLTAPRDDKRWPHFPAQPQANARRVRQLAALHAKWSSEGRWNEMAP